MKKNYLKNKSCIAAGLFGGSVIGFISLTVFSQINAATCGYELCSPLAAIISTPTGVLLGLLLHSFCKKLQTELAAAILIGGSFIVPFMYALIFECLDGSCVYTELISIILMFMVASLLLSIAITALFYNKK